MLRNSLGIQYYALHMGNRWYTQDLHVVTKSYIRAYKKSASSNFIMEMTTYFTLASVSNH